ncbi:unnamed protein product [Pleuronectes platessa]|uniref:Pyrroline-5-carboxylate reductase catalytic N-terminal domain-containing protein n=1 Tax=Pleuronectes platessa TaxID=8262 RepID=A0A9N7Y9M7_PLEPL|nr:unnamed protein product [Pleuronectes platessa]
MKGTGDTSALGSLRPCPHPRLPPCGGLTVKPCHMRFRGGAVAVASSDQEAAQREKPAPCQCIMPDDMARPLVRGSGASRHHEALMSEPGAPVIGILGTGDFSRSLARRLVASGYHVLVGSRNPKHSLALFPEDAELTSQMEAATQADLVFVAVFPEHHSTLLQLKPALAGKTLVDVSNGLQINRDGPSNAHQLADLFPESFVVKGFNTISAWNLQVGPRDGSRQVFLCSDNPNAKNSVMELCRRLGFVPVDMGQLSSSLEIENLPFHLFPSWHVPCRLHSVAVHLVSTCTTSSVTSCIPSSRKGRVFSTRCPSTPSTSPFPPWPVVMLALVYLPGLCAAYLQLWRCTKYKRFPSWLDRWLTRRKQFGLCSFLCAALHAVYSLCLPMRKSARYKLLNAAFKQVKAGVEDSWVDEEVWRMELYLSVGIMALGAALFARRHLAALSGQRCQLEGVHLHTVQSRLLRLVHGHPPRAPLRLGSRLLSGPVPLPPAPHLRTGADPPARGAAGPPGALPALRGPSAAADPPRRGEEPAPPLHGEAGQEKEAESSDP